MIRQSAFAILLVTLGLFAGAALVAQDGQAPKSAAKDSGAAELKRLDKAYKEARSAYYKAASEQRAKRKKDPKVELPALVHPDPEYVVKFREAAKRHAESDQATTFLIRALRLTYRSDKVAAKEILEELLDDHVKSKQLSSIASTLTIGAHYLGNDTVRKAMTRIIDKSPHDIVKAAFLYARSSLVVRSRVSTAEERAAAVKDLDRAMELGAGSPHVEMARAAKYELQNLQVGLPAPQIEGKDLDGVAFKLSDYRGKVVVLDFWGDW